MASSSGSSVVVELTEVDNPGASLEEPLDRHTMPALRWWLQCHGMKFLTSWKKDKLIER